jgi:uncharacterized protein YkwD
MSGRRRGGIVLALGAAAMLVAGGAVTVQQLTSDGGTTASVRPSAPEQGGTPALLATDTPAAEATPPQASVPRPVGPPKTTPKTTAKASAPAKGRKKTTSTTPVTGRMSALEHRVVVLTNAERAKHGCGALRGDSRLANAARAHSTDMAVHKYFDHNSQDGTTPWTRIKRAGYAQPGAENIAMGYPTAAAVMQGWMNSPGHRANILNCKLRALGVGVHSGGSGGPWWTQDFGWT